MNNQLHHLEEEYALEICKIVSNLSEARNGLQPIVLDISEFNSICGVMMIVSFQTSAQANSFSNEVEKELKDEGYIAGKSEGNKTSGWYLLDYGELFVHIMSQEARDYYQLEEIWRKGKKIDLG